MTTYTTNFPYNLDVSRLQLMTRLSRRIQYWFKLRELKQSLRQERRQLNVMSDDQLKDLGLSRVDAETEARCNDVPVFRLDKMANF